MLSRWDHINLVSSTLWFSRDLSLNWVQQRRVYDHFVHISNMHQQWICFIIDLMVPIKIMKTSPNWVLISNPFIKAITNILWFNGFRQTCCIAVTAIIICHFCYIMWCICNIRYQCEMQISLGNRVDLVAYTKAIVYMRGHGLTTLSVFVFAICCTVFYLVLFVFQGQTCITSNLSRLTHWGREKWLPYSRRHFQRISLNENV